MSQSVGASAVLSITFTHNKQPSEVNETLMGRRNTQDCLLRVCHCLCSAVIQTLDGWKY